MTSPSCCRASTSSRWKQLRHQDSIIVAKITAKSWYLFCLYFTCLLGFARDFRQVRRIAAALTSTSANVVLVLMWFEHGPHSPFARNRHRIGVVGVDVTDAQSRDVTHRCRRVDVRSLHFHCNTAEHRSRTPTKGVANQRQTCFGKGRGQGGKRSGYWEVSGASFPHSKHGSGECI